MKKIQVNASRNYDIVIDAGLLEKAGKYCLPFCPNKRAAIITDDTVAPLYLDTVENSLNSTGIETIHYIIPSGEASKNGENFLAILNFLAEHQITRTDTVIALGGGVVGDLTGFVAASYLRGIGFIQIPTTLLAMVDSSVGGKTAIDLNVGKNLAGAFYQPQLVLCDYLTLNTLSKEIFAEGCAEVIKYAILNSPSLFNHLEQNLLDFDREMVIAECVSMKRDIVNRDEFESGPRKFLNLGHTVGHAIEHRSAFTLSHGQAVSIGLSIIATCSENAGFCNAETVKSINRILKNFNLPITTDYALDELVDIMLSDKKRDGKKLTFVVPESVGKCVLHAINIADIKTFLNPWFK